MEEIGPFRVNSDQKTLTINKYAWNNVANILFLESPAAVGYSKSDLGIIDENGDKISAKETYIFLLTWLERFPEFKKRDFFIAGESYGGHYIPQLAHIILSKNKLANKTLINLKGVAIGNPFVDTVENRRSQYEYKWHHAFISDEIYNPIRMYCTFKSDNISDETPPCANALRQVDTANIDPYNVYAPICLENSDGSARHTDDLEAGIDQCIDFYVESYLNDEAVKKAFHV
ncbi:hypothetical protein LUZ60_002695 [Juncus effusus]|nr:hypothetical protein LUZ60_002695 [Juncus effusus]